MSFRLFTRVRRIIWDQQTDKCILFEWPCLYVQLTFDLFLTVHTWKQVRRGGVTRSSTCKEAWLCEKYGVLSWLICIRVTKQALSTYTEQENDHVCGIILVVLSTVAISTIETLRIARNVVFEFNNLHPSCLVEERNQGGNRSTQTTCPYLYGNFSKTQ